MLCGELRHVLYDLEPTSPPLPRPIRNCLHNHRACEVPAAVQCAVAQADLHEGALNQIILFENIATLLCTEYC